MQESELIDAIDRRLPQTQCTKCDYPNCEQYAQAIAAGDADINQCPPGGTVTIAALARLLERETLPLNPANGAHEALRIATIREADCIGCKLCIKACPVDCIIGAAKLMHSVIADECSGCELCLPVCPTDCIDMIESTVTVTTEPSAWCEFSRKQTEKFRRRAQQKRERIALLETQREQQKKARFDASPKDEIRAALKRNKQNVT